MKFHHKCGSLVILSKDKKTATRNHGAEEYNNGLLFSEFPLATNYLFQVQIVQKMSSWNGSIIIGVLLTDPEDLSLPSCATCLIDGAWVLSGSSLIINSQTISENYSLNLDQLNDGDIVGVMRKSTGALHFFKNGVDMGMAVSNVPSKVWAVVDMYGKCVQVSIPDNALMTKISASSSSNSMANNSIHSKLHFHSRHGSLIQLSGNKLTAERIRALDEFNNGVVMTNRSLNDGELFEIRLDKLVDKWSGSIEVGVTTHNPDHLEMPTTMTNMRSGTIMMSGNGILVNGKGTKRQYGEFNLDDLKEGDRIGLKRSIEGDLNYYINGVDQGVAATNVAKNVWAVVDLYGMTVKVTIIPEFVAAHIMAKEINDALPADASKHSLDKMWSFHSNHGSNIYLYSNCTVAANYLIGIYLQSQSQSTDLLSGEMRTLVNLTHNFGQHGNSIPSMGRGYFMLDDAENNREDSPVNNIVSRIHRMIDWSFSGLQNISDGPVENAAVMLNQPLRFDELVEFIVQSATQDTLSIILGIVSFERNEIFPIIYPFPTDIQTATWIQQGVRVCVCGIFSNFNDNINLDKLKSGSRIGIMVRSDGTLHFYLNGIDTGEVCNHVVEDGYVFMNLKSVCTKVTLIKTESSVISSSCASYEELKDISKSIEDKEELEEKMPNLLVSLSSNIEVLNSIKRVNRTKFHSISLVAFNKEISVGCKQGVILKKVEKMFSNNFAIGIYSSTFMDLTEKIDLSDLNITWLIGDKNSEFMDFEWSGQLSSKNVVCVERLSMDVYIISVNNCIIKTVSIFTCRDKKNYLVFNLNGSVSEMEAIYNNSTNIQAPISNLTKTMRFSHKFGQNIKIYENGKHAERCNGFDQGVIVCDKLAVDQSFTIKLISMDLKYTSSFSIGLVQLSEAYLKDYMLPRNLMNFQENSWIFKDNNIYHNGCKLNCLLSSGLNEAEKGDIIKLLINDIGSILLYKNDIKISPTNNNYINIQMDDIETTSTSLRPAETLIWYVVVDLHGRVNGVSIVDDNEVEVSQFIFEKKLENQLISSNFMRLQKTEINCSILDRAIFLKNLLFLPSQYFLSSDPVCYCFNCSQHNINEENKEMYHPLGWVAFNLKLPTKLEAKNFTFEKWQKCYKQFSAWDIRKVLDSGDLNVCEANNLTKFESTLPNVDDNLSEKCAPDNHSDYPPIIVYSNLNQQSNQPKSAPIKIQFDGTTISAYAALQGFIKPGSFKNLFVIEGIGSKKYQSSENIRLVRDDLDCHQWMTKERGSIILSSLLICIL